MSSSRNEADIVILDSTLRDGELTPGIRFDIQQKVEIARQLESIGIDIIEVGYPGYLEKDSQVIVDLIKNVRHAKICGLARCETIEILKVGELIQGKAQGRIHLYSNVHLSSPTNEDTALREISQSIRLARSYCHDVQWSAFDATRSNHNFLCAAIAVAIESGATTIGIPDSLGIILPENFSKLIQMLYNRVSNLDRVILSVHCHDDRGMAVENTIAAIESGVRQIECTIDGLGARKGNADLAKVVRTLAEKTHYQTSIQTHNLPQSSAFIHQFIAVNKP